jgi:hypothetical protein
MVEQGGYYRVDAKIGLAGIRVEALPMASEAVTVTFVATV